MTTPFTIADQPTLFQSENPQMRARAQNWVRFAGDDLRQRSFTGQKMSGASLLDSDLSNTTLNDCDLSGASFAGSLLEGAQFDKCRMRGADLRCDGQRPVGEPRHQAPYAARLPDDMWRGARFLGCLMPKANAEGQIFDQTRFDETQMPNAWFAKASLREVGMRETWASEIDFTNASITDPDWSNSGFDHGFFDDCDIHNPYWRDCSFKQASMSSVYIDGGGGIDTCDFNETNLEDANLAVIAVHDSWFDRAWLRRSNWSGSGISRSSFDQADLTGARMNESAFRRCRFDGAKLAVSAKNTDFTGCSFQGTELYGARFEDCSFDEASFEGADLMGATFINCSFDNADLREAGLLGATFTNCSVSNANLWASQVEDPTKWPGATFWDDLEDPNQACPLPEPAMAGEGTVLVRQHQTTTKTGQKVPVREHRRNLGPR